MSTGEATRPGVRRTPSLLSILLVLCLPGPPARLAAQTAAGPGTRVTASADAAVLATVDGRPVTLEDVRAHTGGALERLEIGYQRERHRLIETTLRQLLRDSLIAVEARKRGLPTDDLVLAEAGGTLDPTEVQIATWYQENPDRVQGRPLVQMHDAIASFLRAQRRRDAERTLEARLFRENHITIELQPYRVPLDNEDAPAQGAPGAPVTLVEFSDFQCPYCGGFFHTLEKVREAFGDTVRIVYRQFPLASIHPNAEKAAEASLCAAEQGKFWEMHDLMFGDQARLGENDLKEKAARLGLARTRFDACLDSGREKKRVERDRQDGLRVGVDGTPAVFVNGIPVDGGAVGFDVLARAIREELRRRAP